MVVNKYWLLSIMDNKDYEVDFNNFYKYELVEMLRILREEFELSKNEKERFERRSRFIRTARTRAVLARYKKD